MEQVALKNLFCIKSLGRSWKGIGCFVSEVNLQDPVDHFFNARKEVSRNFFEAESKSQNYKKYKIWNSCLVLTFTSIQEMIGSVINGFFETGKQFIHFGFRDDLRSTAGNDIPRKGPQDEVVLQGLCDQMGPVFLGRIKKLLFLFLSRTSSTGPINPRLREVPII